MQGQHTPIHINWDNTVLDGRHRVKALKKLNINTVKAIRENLEKDEALKFVRDTAVERRNLTANQRLDIVLNAKDLIGDIQERAKEKQKKSIEYAHKNNLIIGLVQLNQTYPKQRVAKDRLVIKEHLNPTNLVHQYMKTKN